MCVCVDRIDTCMYMPIHTDQLFQNKRIPVLEYIYSPQKMPINSPHVPNMLPTVLIQFN